jgi:hypothetical protein
MGIRSNRSNLRSRFLGSSIPESARSPGIGDLAHFTDEEGAAMIAVADRIIAEISFLVSRVQPEE